ncbi:hypothetical protein AncyloWKF20_15230 [Ancylobacter sp. WKF20]|uniref:hypothetical protein n=1 Tax=Ancylobacter sp. WKF20 TaxID=3039801 RepID=UPI00243429C9|nr:hypothetical protein [Ancylobacter sp. WKF20]WGD29125.1 hypothetical protein AncyloWKF20_15230 [Ancylobacter sp. WKF20]
MLVEYENSGAHKEIITFRNKSDANSFSKMSLQNIDAIESLRKLGYEAEARKVIINTVIMAMVSDFLHHIFEALKCLEKRKYIVACNLLRKPMLDSSVYLSWILGDEDDFFIKFRESSPDSLTPRKIGNRRLEIFRLSIEKSGVSDLIDAETVHEWTFDSNNPNGMYRIFQHAVHLITVDRIQLKTSTENFNFIFKNPSDDDIYEEIYRYIPYMMLFMSGIIVELFDKMKSMDSLSKRAFITRSRYGYYLLSDNIRQVTLISAFTEILGPIIRCFSCSRPIKITKHNLARIILTDSFRCTHCSRTNELAFSWSL